MKTNARLFTELKLHMASHHAFVFEGTFCDSLEKHAYFHRELDGGYPFHDIDHLLIDEQAVELTWAKSEGRLSR